MSNNISINDKLTDFLLYSTPSGDIKIDVFLHNETIWLSQERMAQLFGVQRPAITKHLKNIFQEGELDEQVVCSILELPTQHGAIKGKTQTANTKFYNLDAILSVGYRVNSHQATQFRIWATKTLKDYIIKGFAIDDDRLKNGHYFGKDYFRELLERIRSIRTSERRIYQQITDIFSECCLDYDKSSEAAKKFYAKVQNKFHYAITGKTAAELISHRADQNKQKMGLMTYKNAPDGRVLKSDTRIAKNYLQEDEIKKLERTISSYFDYIENQIEQKNTLSMSSFSESVNKFLAFNDFKVLDGLGTISHEQAKQKAYKIYDAFNKTQAIHSDFDKLTKKLQDKS